MVEAALTKRIKLKAGAGKSFAFIEIYRASPLRRIEFIKAGVPARTFKLFCTELDFDQKALFHALSLKTATINRKAAANKPLSADESERVVGLAKLVGQLESMVEESGDLDGFDATAWVARWLREPLPALGGSKPMELLDTMEGQALVSRSLAQIQSGAYA
jgi:putative toxin-antitoxin system antitoxin component (TIGR02293 family)